MARWQTGTVAAAIAVLLAGWSQPASGEMPGAAVIRAFSAVHVMHPALRAVAWSVQLKGAKAPKGHPGVPVFAVAGGSATARMFAVRTAGARPTSWSKIWRVLPALIGRVGPNAHVAVEGSDVAFVHRSPCGAVKAALSVAQATRAWTVCSPTRAITYAFVPGLPGVAVDGVPVNLEILAIKVRHGLRVAVGSPLLAGG